MHSRKDFQTRAGKVLVNRENFNKRKSWSACAVSIAAQTVHERNEIMKKVLRNQIVAISLTITAFALAPLRAHADPKVVVVNDVTNPVPVQF